MAETKTCICGREFVPETPVQDYCSAECYNSGRQHSAAPGQEPEIDYTQYYQFLPNEALQAMFPRLAAMNAHADVLGPCRGAEWENIQGHAHAHAGIICVKGPIDNLFEDRAGGVKPTSLFLHEYAHLELPDEWHSPRFGERLKELHKEHKVAHDKKVEAIFSIIVSLIIIGVGLGLYLGTGSGYIGIGAGIALVMNLGWVFNSFQQEQIQAHEHDMRRWRDRKSSP